jgi:hypothetical protein
MNPEKLKQMGEKVFLFFGFFILKKNYLCTYLKITSVGQISHFLYICLILVSKIGFKNWVLGSYLILFFFHFRYLTRISKNNNKRSLTLTLLTKQYLLDVQDYY